MKCVICGNDTDTSRIIGRKEWCGYCELYQTPDALRKKSEWLKMLRDFRLSSMSGSKGAAKATKRHTKRVEYLQSYVNEKKGLWDVCCGGGWLLSAAKNLGWRGVMGNEASYIMQVYIKDNYKIDIYRGHFCDIVKDEKIPYTYNAVTYVNAIEHVMNPIESLKAAKSILVDKGRIFIGCHPENMKELTTTSDFHVFEFSLISYYCMFEKAGLRIVSRKNPQEDEDLTYFVLRKK